MPLTVGRQLKRAREQHHLTLEKAAEATHIRLHYLQALEADDYSVMPSAAQARGFLRNYSGFLELDLDAVLTEIQRQQPVEPGEVSGPLPEVEVMPPPPEPIPSSQVLEPAPSRGRSIVVRLRRGRPGTGSKRTIPAQGKSEESTPVEVESGTDGLQKPEGSSAECRNAPLDPEAIRVAANEAVQESTELIAESKPGHRQRRDWQKA
jgi:transcriptional regulator with XRE-family HTH domain